MKGKRRNCQSKEEEGMMLPRMRMRTSYTEVALTTLTDDSLGPFDMSATLNMVAFCLQENKQRMDESS